MGIHDSDAVTSIIDGVGDSATEAVVDAETPICKVGLTAVKRNISDVGDS